MRKALWRFKRFIIWLDWACLFDLESLRAALSTCFLRGCGDHLAALAGVHFGVACQIMRSPLSRNSCSSTPALHACQLWQEQPLKLRLSTEICLSYDELASSTEPAQRMPNSTTTMSTCKHTRSAMRACLPNDRSSKRAQNPRLIELGRQFFPCHPLVLAKRELCHELVSACSCCEDVGDELDARHRLLRRGMACAAEALEYQGDTIAQLQEEAVKAMGVAFRSWYPFQAGLKGSKERLQRVGLGRAQSVSLVFLPLNLILSWPQVEDCKKIRAWMEVASEAESAALHAALCSLNVEKAADNGDGDISQHA